MDQSNKPIILITDNELKMLEDIGSVVRKFVDGGVLSASMAASVLETQAAMIRGTIVGTLTAKIMQQQSNGVQVPHPDVVRKLRLNS